MIKKREHIKKLTTEDTEEHRRNFNDTNNLWKSAQSVVRGPLTQLHSFLFIAFLSNNLYPKE